MTDLNTIVARRTIAEHSKHKRRIIASLEPGDVIGFRLERSSRTMYLPIESLFNQAEIKSAGALVNFNTAPRPLPRRKAA